MLAFLTNIGLPELIVIAGLGVIIFGKRLPEVAARAYGELVKLRRTIDRVRRESGIDRELRDIEFTVRDAARKAALKEPLPPPAEFRAEHDPGLRGLPKEAEDSSAGARAESRAEAEPDQATGDTPTPTAGADSDASGGDGGTRGSEDASEPRTP